MKKFAVLLLTLALFCALAVPSFAATVGEGGSDSANVKGSYVAGSTAATVYSVDIRWGSMEITYTGASEGTWNPLTHKYDGATEAAWSCGNNANLITVTNHSNAAVTATLAYASGEGFTGITGEFDSSTLNLATASGTERDNAPTGSAKLTLKGALASGVENKTVIGTVTVTLGGN